MKFIARRVKKLIMMSLENSKLKKNRNENKYKCSKMCYEMKNLVHQRKLMRETIISSVLMLK